MTDLREPAIKEEIEREKSVSPGEEVSWKLRLCENLGNFLERMLFVSETMIEVKENDFGVNLGDYFV